MASIVVRTLLIYFVIMISLKIMGKRQIGELEVGELVSTLLISEIASIPIADSDIPMLNAVIPIILIVSLEIVLSTIKNKKEKYKKFIDGAPSYLIYQGKLIQEALCDNRISINEVLSEMRIQGIGNIKDVYYAILEPNGKISLLQNNEKNSTAHAIIIDGEINTKRLSALGYNENWLNSFLRKKKTKASDVFLMTIDDSGAPYIIIKEEKE